MRRKAKARARRTAGDNVRERRCWRHPLPTGPPYNTNESSDGFLVGPMRLLQKRPLLHPLGSSAADAGVQFLPQVFAALLAMGDSQCQFLDAQSSLA